MILGKERHIIAIGMWRGRGTIESLRHERELSSHGRGKSLLRRIILTALTVSTRGE